MAKGNELRTRSDLANLLLDWLRPLEAHYSDGHAMLHIGNTAAHYGEKSARMEGFSRVLWGIGPLLATENEDLSGENLAEAEKWNRICLDGLAHGTDPSHEEYWGDVYDYDQKMVEMAAIATTLLLAPGRMWEPLGEMQKARVRAWLNQINSLEVHANNWRFFRILVNVFFTVQNLQPNQERLTEDLQVIENCYDGDGWYYDGNPKQMDYYIPFAMHYYSLIYAHFMKDVDQERCKKFLERSKIFYKDYIYWFANDGSSVPFGRSLTYRFAHSAFFSAFAMVNADDEQTDYGVVKGMLLRNMRYWAEQPIFDTNGILTIGYNYPNLFMSERYNAPGSPYWSFKAFLALALPAEHPFWRAEEKEVTYKAQAYLSHPHMLITHEGNHAQIYPVGQHSAAEHGNCAAKYEKFVYSNQFGFSVSRGTSLESGAFDNTLAVSAEGQNFYRMRSDVESFQMTEEYIQSVYHIGKKVKVESIIIPLGAWHVRIHHIDTDEAIDVAEGGYAIPKERCGTVVVGRDSGKYTQDMVHQDENSLFCNFSWGVSGIMGIAGGEDGIKGVADTVNWRPRLIQAFPNTNLLHNLTVIPTLYATLEPGKYTLTSCVYADAARIPEEGEVPKIAVSPEGESYVVSFGERKIFVKLHKPLDKKAKNRRKVL